jgi:hypothetical protein
MAYPLLLMMYWRNNFIIFTVFSKRATLNHRLITNKNFLASGIEGLFA